MIVRNGVSTGEVDVSTELCTHVIRIVLSVSLVKTAVILSVIVFCDAYA